MNEDLYFIREYDYEKLDYLRRNTTLSPIISLKVLKKRLEAEYSKRQLIKYNINDNIDNYLEEANIFEYLCRIKIWKNKYTDSWLKYGDKMSLAEYSIMTLNGLIKEEKLIRNYCKR